MQWRSTRTAQPLPFLFALNPQKGVFNLRHAAHFLVALVAESSVTRWRGEGGSVSEHVGRDVMSGVSSPDDHLLRVAQRACERNNGESRAGALTASVVMWSAPIFPVCAEKSVRISALMKPFQNSTGVRRKKKKKKFKRGLFFLRS